MVKLKKFTKSIKNSLNDEVVFINRKTGEIKAVEEYYLNYDSKSEKRILVPWQEKLVDEGRNILKGEDFISCNIKKQLKEYSLMEDFIKNNLSNEERGEIEFIINGENRLKRFHLAILGTYYESLWDIFIEEKIEEECKKWLYDNELTYY